MKKKHWITLIAGVALVLGIYAIPAITQQQAAQQQVQMPYQVAVIDLAQVIRAHPDFAAKQAALQKMVTDAEAIFQKKQDELEAEKKSLETMQVRTNTPEYQTALDNLTRKAAQFEADVRAQHRRFALQNSQIMYETYQDIKGTIGRYAQARGIAQVTDYRDFDVDPADPPTVAEDMDQRLVWFSPQLNITNVVIQQIYAQRQQQIPEAIAKQMQEGRIR